RWLDALVDLGQAARGRGTAKRPPSGWAEQPPERPRRRAHAEVGKAANGPDLAKDLYGVSRLAVLLSEIKSMVGSAAFDAVYADGDASLPRQMKAWATQGVSLLQAMVAAEMADLMDDAPTDEAMALAASPLSDVAYGALVKAVAADSRPGGRWPRSGRATAGRTRSGSSACMTTPAASGRAVSLPRRPPAAISPRAAMRSRRCAPNSPR
ncbi:hypothetical protein CTI14_08670, partial [Methylobacterium radiotolerans]